MKAKRTIKKLAKQTTLIKAINGNVDCAMLILKRERPELFITKKPEKPFILQMLDCVGTKIRRPRNWNGEIQEEYREISRHRLSQSGSNPDKVVQELNGLLGNGYWTEQDLLDALATEYHGAFRKKSSGINLLDKVDIITKVKEIVLRQEFDCPF